MSTSAHPLSLRGTPVSSAGSERLSYAVPFGHSLQMTLKHLRWMALAAPIALVGVLELGRELLGVSTVAPLQRLGLNAFVIVVSIIFSVFVLRSIEGVQKRLARQNRELLALHEAGVDVTSDLSLEVVLQKVCEQARQLVGSRYGALAVMRTDGSIETFITSGIDEETRRRIGHPPVGRGLLGVPLHHGERLRVEEISRDPRAVGFPPNHPPMSDMIAVPIRGNSPFAGNLYLTEKIGKQGFTADDDETLSRFAVQAAIAIDNAWLHQRIHDLATSAERQRIAHEMHDGLAQVLGYVNTKAQAVDGFLKNGNVDRAREQLQQLAGAARDVYADVREMIIGLRTLSGVEGGMPEAIREYAMNWSEQTGIEIDLDIDPSLRLTSDAELQVLRIAQETLTNVRRHARAESVQLRWTVAGHEAVLTVRDDGVGFRPGAEKTREGVPRFGLSTMKERAQSLGGELSVDSIPEAGTMITLRIPLGQHAAQVQ